MKVLSSQQGNLKVIETQSVLKRERYKAPIALIEYVATNFRLRIDVSPTKPVRKLSAQTCEKLELHEM